MANRPPSKEGQGDASRQSGRRSEAQAGQYSVADIVSWIESMRTAIPDLMQRVERARGFYGNIPELHRAIAEVSAQTAQQFNHSPEIVKRLNDYLAQITNEDMSGAEQAKTAEKVLEKKPAEAIAELAKTGLVPGQKAADKFETGDTDKDDISYDASDDQIDAYLMARGESGKDLEPAEKKSAFSVFDKIFYKKGTIGGSLGWTNATSDLEKVNDIELLFASCFDLDFVRQHQTVRNLLDASGKEGTDDKFDDVLSILRARSKKEPISPEQQKTVEKSRLSLMLKLNKSLGIGLDGGLSENELTERFERVVDKLSEDGGYDNWTDQAKASFKENVLRPAGLIRILPGGSSGEPKEYNLVDICKLNDLSGFSYDKYMNGVKKYQIGLQVLGGLRDDAIQGKHSENAGHSQFVGKTKLWMPVSTEMARHYVDSDVVKRNGRDKAGGHVHECGGYNEDTGINIYFRKELLAARRKELMETRDFNATNLRMMKNAMGMNSREEPHITEEIVAGGRKRKVFWLGGKPQNGGEGDKLIYKALHKTYDQGMIDARGYKLTAEEAKEMYINDVIIPFVANNPYDWNMCLASVVGNAVGFKPSEAVKNAPWGGSESKPKEGEAPIDPDKQDVKGFCVAVPTAAEPGYKLIYSLNEMIDFANERIMQNLIHGYAVHETVAHPPVGRGD